MLKGVFSREMTGRRAVQKIKKTFLAADQKNKYFYPSEGGVEGVVGSLGAVCGDRDKGGHSVM